MACSARFLLFFPLILLISGTLSHNPILPKAAFFPVTKDLSTLQYVADLFVGSNLAPVKVVLDLNAPFSWLDCKSLTSHKKPIRSFSLKCSMANSCSVRADHPSKSCTLRPENPVSGISTSGDLNEDVMAVKFLDDGSDSFAQIEQFLFSCAPNLLLQGLSKSARGLLGLSSSRISLPSQIFTTFGFLPRKFSLCLSPSSGAVFLGENPYVDKIPMMYTPLISDRTSLHQGYHVNLKSIKMSGKKLSLHQKGIIGAKLSTIAAYTTMESKIYRTFVNAYVKAAGSMNLTFVQGVAPFELCWIRNQENLPVVELVLQSEMVKWRMNAVVDVGDDVMCLAFLDGGLGVKDEIVVGGFQMEDYFLEFNLGNSMLGFSAVRDQKCSGFASSRGIL